MKGVQEEQPQPATPSRLDLLRGWVSTHRRPAQAIAVVGILLLLASGYFAYLAQKESSAQVALRDRIGRFREIAAISPERLQEVTRKYERIKGAVPAGNLKETDVYQAVLNLASSETDLDVQMSYRGDSQAKVGNATYRVMSFSMTVSGPYDPVWQLLKEMDRPPEGLATLLLQKVSMSGTERASASADFVVYTELPKG